VILGEPARKIKGKLSQSPDGSRGLAQTDAHLADTLFLAPKTISSVPVGRASVPAILIKNGY
jgi:hypothetical protein